MNDKRKISVWIVIGLFMVVTTFHVGFYASTFEKGNAIGLSWPFALAVDLAIILCSYFTKYIITSKPAWVGYFVFTIMSGMMNLGWIQPGWDLAAISYAIFPTLAIALLGWLFRQVDKLPVKTGKTHVEKTGKKLEILVEKSTGTGMGIPPTLESIPLSVHSIMETYGIKKSRAYEIIKEEKSRLNGHNS